MLRLRKTNPAMVALVAESCPVGFGWVVGICVEEKMVMTSGNSEIWSGS
jgi:hypothetical protein